MLIRFFKKSYFAQLAGLVLLALIFWVPGTLLLIKNGFQTIGTHEKLSLFIGQPAGFFLFLFSAFLANHIATTQKMTDRNSYLTAFFFVLTGSSIDAPTQTLFFLAAAFFFLLFYQKVFRFQNTPHIITTAFDAGFYLGITGLFYPPAAGLLPFVWIALIIYQTDQWRPYVTAVIGMMLPLFFAISGYYLFGETQTLFHYWNGFFHFRTTLNGMADGVTMAIFLWIAFLTLVAALSVAGRLSGFNLNKRQHALTALWGILFTAGILLPADVPLQAFIILAGPVALVFGIYFSHIKKLKWANLLLWGWLVFIIVHRYLLLFHVA